MPPGDVRSVAGHRVGARQPRPRRPTLEREEETKALSLAKPDAAVRLWRTAVEGMIAWRQGLVRDRRRRLELRLLETAMHTAKGVGSFRLRLAREGVFRKEIERALAASPA